MSTVTKTAGKMQSMARMNRAGRGVKNISRGNQGQSSAMSQTKGSMVGTAIKGPDRGNG